MPTQSPDEVDYRFLTAPGAIVHIRLAADPHVGAELQLFGNRAGILSLANALLWLLANGYRREILSLGQLPFVCLEGSLSVCLRVSDEQGTGMGGVLTRADRGEQFDWVIPEDDLRDVALVIHHLACVPWHEYDRLLMAEGSTADVHVRMTDAAQWMQRGHS